MTEQATAPATAAPTTAAPAAQPTTTPAAAPAGLNLSVAPPAAEATATSAAQAPLPAGFDRAKLYADVAQTGAFDASTVAAFRAANVPDAVIADIQAGYVASAQAAQRDVTEKLGGADGLKRLMQWMHGPGGLDREQIVKLNESVNSSDPATRDLAAKSLRAMFESATGETLAARATPTLEGGAPPRVDPNPLPVFRTAADYDKADRDPRNRPEHPEYAAYSGWLALRLAEYGKYKMARGS